MSDAQDVQIRTAKDGPYLVQGTVVIEGSDGATIEESDGNIALCRCGASEDKPFCDGTHSEVGFSSEVTAD